MATITDQTDNFTVIDLADSNSVKDPVDIFNVSDGDLAVAVSEVKETFNVAVDSADNINVSDQSDNILISFSEVLQAVTTNITNDNSVFTGIAGTDLGGYRIVIAKGSQIEYADNTIPSHSSIVTGIITQAVLAGQSVNVTISGEITEITWNWTLNIPIFLTANGLMTQTVPVTGFLLQVGYPTTSISMVIDIKTAIILSA